MMMFQFAMLNIYREFQDFSWAQVPSTSARANVLFPFHSGCLRLVEKSTTQFSHVESEDITSGRSSDLRKNNGKKHDF